MNNIRHRTFSSKSTQKRNKRRKRKWGKFLSHHKKRIRRTTSISLVLLSLFIINRYFFHHSKYLITSVTINEINNNFDTQEIIDYYTTQTLEKNYRKAKRSLDHGDHPRVASATIQKFEGNELQLQITYKHPEIIFTHQDNKRATQQNHIHLLHTGAQYTSGVALFSLPRYHTGDITGIFHQIPSHELIQRYTALSETFDQPWIEYHPATSVLLLFKWGQQIAFGLEKNRTEQLEKFDMIQSYFSWTQPTQIDLSSAPYAIIRP